MRSLSIAVAKSDRARVAGVRVSLGNIRGGDGSHVGRGRLGDLGKEGEIGKTGKEKHTEEQWQVEQKKRVTWED